MSNEYMLIPYHLRERLSDALFMSEMCCDDLRNIVASAPMHSIPAHDGEAVYQVQDSETFEWFGVPKAQYEHVPDNKRRILFTAPPRVVDDLMPLIKRMNSYLIMSGIQGNKDSDNPIEVLKYDLLKAIKNER